MGDAVFAAFLQVLAQTFAELLKKELQSEHGLDNERKSLICTVEMIQAALRDAEMMQLSETQKLWFGKLKDASYNAMEVLDEYLYEVQRRKVIHLSRVRNNRVSSALNPRRQSFRHSMAKNIIEISKEIDNLQKSGVAFLCNAHGQTSQHPEGSQHPTPSSSFPPSQVHCRQNDRERIVNMLLRPNLQQNVEVVPILGEAYIGKTTVAQLVIADDRVSRFFELRAWVHVSNEFNIGRITADIIESIEGFPFPSSNLDNLQKHLEKLLRGRKYLLVLDDYWKKNFHDWEQLSSPFLTDAAAAAGSKVLVTTRITAVAQGLGTSGFYYPLQGLPEEDCWSLFCRYALGRGRERESYNFGFQNSRLREQVIQKCKGVPFIAASLGHRMRQEKDISKWPAILQEENWESNSTDFMRSLRTNYAQLDSHLKPCFAYTSIIPPKFQFEEEWLIQNWMAHGFIPHLPNPQNVIEDIGGCYFRSLVGQSFFQRAYVGHTRERDHYSMSQMMQGLALHVSDGECYVLEGLAFDVGDIPCRSPEKVRHLTVLADKLDSQKMFDAISQCKSLHTLLVVGGSADCQLRIPDVVLENNHKRLRVLDVSNFGLTELPNSIGGLIHLRCLQLRGTRIRRLPESICDLYNLQTLGLRNCYHLEELPDKIKYLRKLRHIDLHLDNHMSTPLHGSSHNICSLNHMPEDIKLLIDLQTLSRFVISKRSARQSSISELSTLNHLRGELLISNLHLVTDAQEAADAHLASKQCLRKLELSSSGNNKQANQILENLKPASAINELNISGYTGMACPSWLHSTNDMRNLVTLGLVDFKVCSVLPSLGLLPQLKNLYLKRWDGLVSMDYYGTYGGSSSVIFQSLEKFHLEGMHSLQRWDWDERYAFPRLVELIVKDCPLLRELPRCIQNLRELEDIEIVGCWQLTQLAQMSGLTSLQRLEVSNCGLIQSLPSTGLPRSLQVLSINNCPQLSRCCMSLGSSVSSVWIDGRCIK